MIPYLCPFRDLGSNRNGMDFAEKLLDHSSAAPSACAARGGVSAEGELASEGASMERYYEGDIVF